MMKVIILAGGSGTRLWPLSREKFPKQFIKIKRNDNSLFQETFKRSLLLTSLDEIYVVTNEKYKFLVMGAIDELGYNFNESNIIVEPEAKNTLPAICAGVYEIKKYGNDSVVVFPSDHMIVRTDKFIEIIKNSEILSKDSLITFGIKPNNPNTGFGYIAPGESIGIGFRVKEFKEKPEEKMAKKYVEDGYFWNAGIFLFNTENFIKEVKNHAKNIYDAFEMSNNIKEAFSDITEKLSIDYAIMEKSSNVIVVPADIGWSDLGSFDSFYEVFKKDENNNIVESDNILIDSKNNYIYSEPGKLVSVVGVNDLIIVDNRDALLICKKDQSQKVKEVVNELKSMQDNRVETHVQDYRPWGNYKILEEENNAFKIKRINIGHGKKLSYQSHYHRSEHWIILKGLALVTIDDEERLIHAGESVFIKAGQKHRLENPGKIALEIIEVQMGDYLEEDDIIRFDDNYDME